MERKKKPNGLLISGLISALAALAIVAVAPGSARPPEKAQTSKSSEDRGKGQKGSSSAKDNDGDADSDSNTAYTEDNDTNDGGTPNNVADDGDNAHPSGKDRSVENGKSGNQGRSESNPDDSKGPMRYEGELGDDKPNGPGGTDLADQDGNNGCGNDDDFDDDNNGWCGKPQREDDENEPTCPDGSVMPAHGECEPPRLCPDGSRMPANGKCEEVGGELTERCPDGSAMPASGNVEDCDVQVDENPGNPDDDVLGDQFDRDEQSGEPGPSVLGIRLSPALDKPLKVAGAVLPFTGGDVLLFLALALALFVSGLVIMKATKVGRNHG